jgi:hypothetical protein
MGIDLALRASLVWNGEVMDDRVFDRPEPITIGASGKTTFVTPDVGLPAELAIITPGSAGYLLTLGARMRGTVCLGGQQQAVEALVADQPFHAVPIAAGDWGVIDLDDGGRSQLFFQFVPREEQVPIVTRQALHVGTIGFAAFSLLGAVIFALKGIDFGEALARSIGLVALMFAGAAVANVVRKQDNNSKASLAFSIILHTAILSFTFHVYSTESAEAALPGPRELTASYLVSRPDPKPIPVAITSTANLPALAPAPAESAPPTQPLVAPTPSGGNDGGVTNPRPNAGGRGVKAPSPSPFGVLGNPDLKALAGKDLGRGIGKLAGVDGPRGTGPAGPPGPERTTRGKGNNPKGPAGEHKTGDEIGPIAVRGQVCVGNCGGTGPVEIALPPRDPEEKEPQITAREIDEEVRRKAPLFRACYQKEVNRLPTLAGSVVMKWVIGRDGTVKNGKRVGGTLASDGVTQCMELNLRTMRFPPKGPATVTYPFVFTVGS